MNRIILIITIVIIAACINFAQKTQFTKKDKHVEQPVQVIFDTDLGNDIDDVLALQMLLNYHKQGKVNLLGISISKANPLAIEYIDGYCNFNNIPDIPLGYVYDGPTKEDGKYLRQTLDTIINGQKVMFPQRSLRDSIPEGYVLLRKLLSSQKDNSVVVIAVGPETNLERLINSEPDQFCELSGVDLVAKKVKLLSVMGGLYGDEFDFPEWNIIQDLPAAQTVFKKWPTEIIASGWEIGNKLLYPHQSILNDFTDDNINPLCISYKLYEKMPYDRQTWDLTSVLVAVKPEKEYFGMSPEGKIFINEKGKSIFTEEESGMHRYLIHNDENTEDVLKDLVKTVTGKQFLQP
jgi:inosine-uridine nucleoside N-ribohydrolase